MGTNVWVMGKRTETTLESAAEAAASYATSIFNAAATKIETSPTNDLVTGKVAGAVEALRAATEAFRALNGH